MKLTAVCVPTDIIGWHGIGSAEVSDTAHRHAVIDISTWVNDDGIGESTTGRPVKKKFPPTVVLLKNPTLEHTNRVERFADVAYIGTNGIADTNTYTAEFNHVPEQGEYHAFFPHTVDTTPPETPNDTPVTVVGNYQPDELKDHITTEPR